MEKVVYTSEPVLGHPVKMVREMFRDLISSRKLAWRLFLRDTSTQYRQTALGYFWAVFPPLVTSAIFVLMNSSNLLSMGSTDIPYPAYVMMGTVFYGIFSDALNAPLRVVTASRAMLVKINFPREALIVSAILQTLLSFCIKLFLLFLTLAYFNVPVKWTVFLSPVPLAGLLLLGIMIGVFLVPAGVLFQDIGYGLSIVVNGLMFLTPVVYPPPTGGILAAITSCNPLTPLIMSARHFMVGGPGSYHSGMILVILVTCLLLFTGWVIFRLALPIMIERMGA